MTTAGINAVARTVEYPKPLSFEAERIRQDFPALHQKVHGHPLAYLDSAATSQKPRSVIETLARYYREDNANIHRGVYQMSQRATEAYDHARVKVQEFLNAAHSSEIVFVRGATEAINLVASTFGKTRVHSGDEVLITHMEHHSNIVPWQLLCEQAGAKLRVVPITDSGELDLEAFDRLLNERTKLLGIVHVSNALGTINPVKELIRRAHAQNVPVLVDGAQSTPHMRVDVQDLDCDFFVFSGHKVFGPTGIGVLYGKQEHLEAMPPYQGGGDMILTVSFRKTVFQKTPQKFEAGTPNIAGTIGLGAAIDYVNGIGIERIQQYEADLLAYGTESLSQVPGLRMIGTAREKASVLSFVLEDIHPHDIGSILDRWGVAIRTGHHCAQPVMERYSVPATARASLAFYNNRQDIDRLVEGLLKAIEVFH